MNQHRPHISVPIPETLYLELAKQYAPDVSSSIIKILSLHLKSPEDSSEHETNSEASFSWSPLSLPSRTQLRTTYYHKHIVADIVDGKLLWNGEAYHSVSQLINKMRGNTRNNAWRCTEIKLPNSPKWVLADRLRADHSDKLLSDLFDL